MNEPAGFLLTWRTYGTWLHGDARGSIDWQHNAYGTPMLAPSSARLGHVQSRMRHPSVILNADAQMYVASVIKDHCHIRHWELEENAVRSNHVHVVVANNGAPPDMMLSQLKAYATRALRTAGLMPAGVPVWAEGGSTRYLWTPAEVAHACAYVREGQDVPR